MSARTVKVRIAVAVDPSGTWGASGWGSLEKGPATEAAMDTALIDVDPGEARYWIEAEVAIPEPQTVAGTVSPAES